MPKGMPKPTSLMTGCSQGGIGDALARQFAAVRNPSKVAHFSNAEDVEVVTSDVTSSESVDNLLAVLKGRLP